MKKCFTLSMMMIAYFIIAQSVFADVLVDGFCYLDGETNHAGTKVLFTADSPTANTDSTFTIADGSFAINLTAGIYQVSYSHDCWVADTVAGGVVPLFANTTLDDVTLLAPPPPPPPVNYREVSGPQSGTWTPDSVYHVVGDISIENGTSLVIEPGVVVRFMNNDDFNIYGLLTAVGTESEPIVFTSGQDNPQASDWRGIFYYADSDNSSVTRYVNIEYANYGIYRYYTTSTITISYCSFRDCSSGISANSSSADLIDNNTFQNCNNGISCSSSSPLITNNHFNNCSSEGINCGSNSSPSIGKNYITNCGKGIYCGGYINSYPTISNNSIISNSTGISIYYGGPTIINNTICKNTSSGIDNRSTGSIILNNIIYENRTAIYAYSTPSSLGYNLFWANTTTSSGGDLPAYFGELLTVNNNGNPCDPYMNLFMDPLLVDPLNSVYQPMPNSPCIDAGNPDLENYDPDGTIADIGAYYFNQNTPFANFEADVTSGIIPLEVSFSDLSLPLTNPIVSWHWDFGDGNTSTLQNPTNTYHQNKYSTVTLIVTDSDGLVDTLVKSDYILSHFSLIEIPSDYLTIQEGIDASFDGDTVLVSPGIYQENINFNGKNITVASLFLTTQDTAYVSQTIIDADGVSVIDVVTFENGEDSTTMLCGFTVKNGGTYSDGLRISGSSPKINNMTITNNKGAGIIITSGSNSVISNCRISNNTGGGIQAEGSDAIISYCKIENNSGYSASGLYIYQSNNLILDHNEITNNSSTSIASIHINDCSPTLHHNLISNNTTGGVGAGGIRCLKASPVLINNTIANNSGELGGGIRCANNSNPVLINNNIWGNTATENGNQIMLGDDTSDPNFYFNNIEGGIADIGLIDGATFDGTYENCINEDPLFANVVNGDFTLSESSPCIDSGDPSQPDDPDLTPCDMGYQYYHHNLAALFEADHTWAYPSFEVNFTDLTLGNPTAWAWDLNGDGNIDSYEQNPSFTYNSFGRYSVSLTTSNASEVRTRIKADYIHAGFTPKSNITSITDVPEDQGGKVFVGFTRSYYDTDTLMDWPAGYNVEMNDGSGWISIASVGAYGSDNYTSMCNTPIDSTQYNNGLIDFRVIAIMQEGNFASETSQGYSVDNLAPAVPDNIDYELLTNEITINWNNCPDHDFAYFAIYKSDVSGIFAETPFATTTQAAFTDEIAEGEIAYYVVTATDFNGNESAWSYEIETLPAMRLELKQGWSGISAYIEPTDAGIENMFSSIEPELVILQNASGMYWPGQNVNTLGAWDTHEGYQVKVASEVALSISGTRTLDRSLILDDVWNLIPVLSECAVNVEELFDGKDVVMVKEVAGWRTYWPEYGISTLEVLEPGKAYFVLMETGEELVFPECDGTKSPAAARTPTGLQTLSELIPWQMFRPTAITHSIAIPALAVSEIQHGNIITAFDESGNCYGLAIWEDENTSITLFGDDPTTALKDGFADGEPLHFGLWNVENENELDLVVTFDESLPNADFSFHNNGLSALASLKVSSTGIGGLSSLARPQITPNPARDEFIVKLKNVGQVEGSLRIRALDGRPVGDYEITSTETSIDISNLSAGVYLLEISVNDTGFIDKLIKR